MCYIYFNDIALLLGDQVTPLLICTHTRSNLGALCSKYGYKYIYTQTYTYKYIYKYGYKYIYIYIHIIISGVTFYCQKIGLLHVMQISQQQTYLHI